MSFPIDGVKCLCKEIGQGRNSSMKVTRMSLSVTWLGRPTQERQTLPRSNQFKIDLYIKTELECDT